MIATIGLSLILYEVVSVLKHHTMKTYEGVKVQLHMFLAFALDAGEWPA
jgi:hypothetical protein